MRKITFALLLAFTLTTTIAVAQNNASNDNTETGKIQQTQQKLGQPVDQPEEQKNINDPRQILGESHRTASNITDPSDQAGFLFSLLKAGIGLKVPKTQIESWAREMFLVSKKIEDPQNRVADEAIAAGILGKEVDAKLGLEKLQEVDSPEVNSLGEYSDPRVYRCLELCLLYLKEKKLDRMPLVKEVMVHLGETGEYPYIAVGALVKALSSVGGDKEKSEASAIFGQAIGYLERGSKFYSTTGDFYELLKDAKGLVPQATWNQAVKTFIEKELNRKYPRSNKSSWHLTAVIKDKPPFNFTDPKLRTILELYLLIKDDPELAEMVKNAEAVKKIKEDYPNLPFDAEIQEIKGQIIQVSEREEITAEEAETSHRQLTLSLTLQQLQKAATADAAAAILPKLKDDLPDNAVYHVIGLSWLSRMYVAEGKTDLASQYYTQMLKESENIPDSSDRKLIIVVTMAKAAMGMGDIQRFQELEAKVFQIGEYTWKRSGTEHPDWRINGRLGFGEMSQILVFACERGQLEGIDMVRKMSDPGLKAFLLLSAIEGITNKTQSKKASP